MLQKNWVYLVLKSSVQSALGEFKSRVRLNSFDGRRSSRGMLKVKFGSQSMGCALMLRDGCPNIQEESQSSQSRPSTRTRPYFLRSIIAQ